MIERITAEEARQLTRKALTAECALYPFIYIIDAAIRVATSDGEWTICPLVALNAEPPALITRYVAALRGHYQEQGFQWKEPAMSARLAITATQQDVELSWAETHTIAEPPPPKQTTTPDDVDVFLAGDSLVGSKAKPSGQRARKGMSTEDFHKAIKH